MNASISLKRKHQIGYSMLTQLPATKADISADRFKIDGHLAYLRTRLEREGLTDVYGASVRRLMVWPERLWHPDEDATPDEIAILRGLLKSGDAAIIQGPLEYFAVLAFPYALDVIEAMEEAFCGWRR